MKRMIRACLLVAGAFVVTAYGDVPQLSKEERQSASTDIAIGTVKVIYTEETKEVKWHNIVGVIEIEVSKVEKGDKLAAGDAVYARFWKQHWIGNGIAPPFADGHVLPKKGDRVRAYLKKNDGGYDLLLPNGFDVIAKAKEQKAK